MKTNSQLLGAVSAFALVVMSSAPALAEGTSAGSTITNNVCVSYDVGGVTQNAVTASDTFTVDQRVNVNVEFIGAATSVSPGQNDAVIAFDVTNLSNSIVDLDLSAALTAGTGAADLPGGVQARLTRPADPTPVAGRPGPVREGELSLVFTR